MSDGTAFLALRFNKNGHGEACLCSTREEAQKKLYEIMMMLYAHEHATVKSAKNYAELEAVVSKQTGLPFKMRIIETHADGPWFPVI